MIAIAELIILLGAAIAGAMALLGPAGRKSAGYLVSNLLAGAFDFIDPLLVQLKGLLAPALTEFVAAAQSEGPAIRAALEQPVADVAKLQLQLAADNLTATGESFKENALARAADALAGAFGFGMASAGVTAAFESVFPEKLNVLNGAGPMIAQMAGFAEVSSAIRDPLYRAAFGQAAEYLFDSIFKPKLPREADAIEWHSRGLLTDAQLETVFGVSGLKTEYEKPYVQAAYRPISAFIAIRLFETGLFDEAAVRDVMQFNGLRPIDIDRMVKSADYLTLGPTRAAALGQVRTAWERGAISDADFDSDLEYLEVPSKARPIIKFGASITKLIELDTLYRKSVSEAYLSGQMTDAEYVPHLEAIGINPPDAEAHYAVDSIKLHGKEIAAQKKSAAAAAKKLQSEQVKLALAQYNSGAI